MFQYRISLLNRLLPTHNFGLLPYCKLQVFDRNAQEHSAQERTLQSELWWELWSYIQNYPLVSILSLVQVFWNWGVSPWFQSVQEYYRQARPDSVAPSYSTHTHTQWTVITSRQSLSKGKFIFAKIWLRVLAIGKLSVTERIFYQGQCLPVQTDTVGWRVGRGRGYVVWWWWWWWEACQCSSQHSETVELSMVSKGLNIWLWC